MVFAITQIITYMYQATRLNLLTLSDGEKYRKSNHEQTRFQENQFGWNYEDDLYASLKFLEETCKKFMFPIEHNE